MNWLMTPVATPTAIPLPNPPPKLKFILFVLLLVFVVVFLLVFPLVVLARVVLLDFLYSDQAFLEIPYFLIYFFGNLAKTPPKKKRGKEGYKYSSRLL